MQLLVTYAVRDEGTIVIFEGIGIDNRPVLFAVDHRYAQAIIDTLDIHGECYVDIEAWQIIGRVA
jgi:hypothetical protein